MRGIGVTMRILAMEMKLFLLGVRDRADRA